MSQNYLIENILPENELHILAGPSGAGKTRLLFQSLREWQQEGTFLGFKCAPFPETLYLACDRSQDSVEETMKSFPGLRLNWHSVRGVSTILETTLAKFPKVKLIIIDGIATLVPDGKINDYNIVSKFACQLGHLCTTQKLTMFGIGHSNKTKEGERYPDPRQRILGSVAWAAYVETVFNLEAIAPDSTATNKTRRLFIGPRNHAEHEIRLEMENGLFVPAFNPVIEEAPKFSKSESVVYGIIGTLGTAQRQEIVVEAGKLNLSPRTVDRCLQSLTQMRVIRSERYGQFSVDKEVTLPHQIATT